MIHESEKFRQAKGKRSKKRVLKVKRMLLTQNSAYKQEVPIKEKKIKHTVARKKTSKWETF